MYQCGRGRIVLVALSMLCAVMLAACGAAGDDRQLSRLLSQKETPAATTVGMDVCVNCHFTWTQQWLGTKHANLNPDDPSDLSYAGYPSQAGYNASAPCANCHDPLGDGGRLIAGVTGASGVNRPVVGCESCHGGGSNHYGTGPIGPTRAAANVLPAGAANLGEFVAASGWFNTCTSCHELLEPGAAFNKAVAVHDAGGGNPMTVDQVITDTHFATAGIWVTSGTGAVNNNIADITGYAMDFANEKVCSNCHNSHNGSFMDINREWAESVHANTAKDGLWARYNWSCNAASNVTCGDDSSTGLPSDRRDCQRCHTTTGFTAFAEARKDGDNDLAKTIAMGGMNILTFSTAFKPEMLECNGCHTDNQGTLRNPGAMLTPYFYDSVGVLRAYTPYQYPDVYGSNICMSCHTGRKNGETVKQLNQQPNTGAVNFDSLVGGDVSSHARAAGGTMFKGIGYEYPGRDYANSTDYVHNKIGTSALSLDTGTNGPCVGCHMYRSGRYASHLFEAAATNAAANIFYGATSDICFNLTCHAMPPSALTTMAQGAKNDYISARLALKSQLKYVNGGAANIDYGRTAAGNWLTPPDTDSTGNGTGKPNFGAYFNYSYLNSEPGAFVHNGQYVRKLIYDSIDWLDDNTLNYSTGVTLQTNEAAQNGKSWQAGAMRYLLRGGTPNPYSAAERP